jgi:putative Holliday junction resolvase
VLGIDPGSKRIGLALSDETGRIAFPHSVLERGAGGVEAAVARIAELVKDEGVGRVVVGLPLRLDGKEGPEAKRARAFADALGRAAGVPVELVDERMTTALAERGLRATGVRGERKKAVVDQAAAAVLLQGHLDAMARRDGEERS